jgi:hypothetical protein
MDEDKPSGLDNLSGHPPSRALERLVTGAGDIVMYFDDLEASFDDTARIAT